ncbi:hypothetical protein GGF32_006256 [Allomyces javanicus]|nr:hypothetical protein GGF32_006256 [Allomyces javanicus]
MNTTKIAATLANIETQFDDGRRVVLHKYISVQKALELLERYSGIDREEKRQFKTQYMARYSKDVGKETVYEHKTTLRNVGEKRFGRLYLTSKSLQNMSKETFRNPLTHGILQDLDMSTALDLYVSDRAAALARYKVGKTKFLAVLFNEFPTYALHSELVEMHRVLYDEVAPRVQREFTDIVKFCKTWGGGAVNKGSLLSNLFNAVESVILMKAVDYCRAHDVVPSVLMFDGLMVKRDPERVTERFLAGLHAYTIQETGFDVAWAEKPIPAGAGAKSSLPAFCEDPLKFAAEQVDKCDGVYKDRVAMKVFEHMVSRKSEEDQESWMAALIAYLGEFARKDLKVAGHYYFRRTTSDPWELNTAGEVIDAVFSKPLVKLFPQVKGRIFDLHAEKWGPSRDNGLIIEHFNAFPGFKAKKLDRKVDESEIKLYLDYLLHVCARGREPEYTHILKWIQALLTTGKANGVMLIFHGLEGCGKGMFYTLLCKYVLGDDNCITLNDLASFMNGQFNAHIENKLLVLVDEISSASKAQRAAIFDKLKNALTDEHSVINQKYTRVYKTRNVNNWMGATNNPDAVPLTKTGRHCFVNEISNLFRNNAAYFEQLDAFVKANADAIFTYLVDLDLSHIRLQDFPRNEDRDAMVEASIDPVRAFFNKIIDYSGFPVGLMGGGSVETKSELDVQAIYDMYIEYVRKRFPGGEVKSMNGLSRDLNKAFRPDDESKRLFESKRQQVCGRRVVLYVYKGPSVMDGMDES